MRIFKVDLSDRKQVQDFLALPARVYHDVPQWVPPLGRDERLRLDPRHYPYYRHSTAAFFLASQDGLPLGRIAVLDNRLFNEYNHEKTAFFYLFECMPDPEAAGALFESAMDWAKKRGLEKLLGPRGFTALDGLGLLVRGYQHRPAFGLPYNPPYYVGFVESHGFESTAEIVSGYMSTDCRFPEHIHDLAMRIQVRRGLHIARFATRRQLRQALKNLKVLYNDALAGSTDGIPLTEAEVDALASQMLWFADPHLIKIVMKGERPVGFLFAYPDISAALQKTRGRIFPFGWIALMRELHRTDRININGAGMIEEFRGSGGTAILYSEMFKSVADNPRYHHAEIVQIGLENDKMQREMKNFGVDFFKLHRIYQQKL
jgi:hypothetical protein